MDGHTTKANDMVQAQTEDTIVLVDFEDPADGAWLVINDGVMGGVSSAVMQPTGRGTGAFTGYLSLENNGGFASTRTDVAHRDLSDFSGLEIRVRGDGRTYQLRVRTDQVFDGVSYRASFTAPADEWTTVRLPFARFLPVYRGQVLTSMPPLDPSQVRQIGLLLADKTSGPFVLEVDFIRTFRGIGDRS